MKLNRFLATAILFLAMSFARLNAQTVYITENGKKYHAKNCSLVKTGKKGIELKDAQKQGYEPCKICKADMIAEDKSKKPKKG